MKQFYLIKNPYLNRYIFYEGKNQHNRMEFSVDKGLEKVLEKTSINPKRKAVLYFEDLSDKEIFQIKNYFKKTKINVKENN